VGLTLGSQSGATILLEPPICRVPPGAWQQGQVVTETTFARCRRGCHGPPCLLAPLRAGQRGVLAPEALFGRRASVGRSTRRSWPHNQTSTTSRARITLALAIISATTPNTVSTAFMLLGPFEEAGQVGGQPSHGRRQACRAVRAACLAHHAVGELLA
jgi:hypothetical protein